MATRRGTSRKRRVPVGEAQIAGRRNFLALSDAYCDYERSRFAVLPIPYDATVSYQVDRFGPDAIIAASEQLETFDEEMLISPCEAGIATLDAVEPEAGGPEAMHEAIVKAARKPVQDGKVLIGLGGEHGVTSGLVRAVAARHRGLSILQIDAHLDLRDTYQGTPYSHACVMRRCLDRVRTIVPVGIRTMSAEEYAFLQDCPIEPITARQCQMDDDWIDQALDTLGEKVYVSIDIDGFDPAFAPGTGTPEPGGLDWYQVTGLLQLVAAEKTVVAADIVEVAPIAGQATTEFLAARLAHRLMAYLVARDAGRL